MTRLVMLCGTSCARHALHPVALLHARCHLSGGMGRGDLYHVHPLKSTNRSRVLGIELGVTHVSQSTQPQTGQLHIRKRVLHSMRQSRNSITEALQPAVANWSHLSRALHDAAHTLIPQELYAKLNASCNNYAHEHNNGTKAVKGNISCTHEDCKGTDRLRSAGTNALSAAEAQRLRDGQRLFWYELHQRLGLLEETRWAAELHHLMMWPCTFQRAWIVLPGVPHALTQAWLGANRTPHTLSMHDVGTSMPTIGQDGCACNRTSGKATRTDASVGSKADPSQVESREHVERSACVRAECASSLALVGGKMPHPTHVTALSRGRRDGDDQQREQQRTRQHGALRAIDYYNVSNKVHRMPERITQLTHDVCQAVHRARCLNTEQGECEDYGRTDEGCVANTASDESASTSALAVLRPSVTCVAKTMVVGSWNKCTRQQRTREQRHYLTWCEAVAWHLAMANVARDDAS